MTVDQRLNQLSEWVAGQLPNECTPLAPASGDASFRRYFRLSSSGQSLIAMDAPPDKEDSHPFVAIAEQLEAEGLHVPHIVAQDLSQGFLLLSDLGSRLYLSQLDDLTADRLYGDAMEALRVMQICTPHEHLPPYDNALLQREMGLFRDWFLGRHLGLELSESQLATLQASFDQLAENALEQPSCFVHRDYHSRNLMVVDSGHNPGILDFQDAVSGAVTYDLVSLLKDCYIAWPRERVVDWVKNYQKQWQRSGGQEVEPESYLRWFDLMGMQRHLKAIGIFARLNHRDGKPGYLNDIPRTFAYVREVCELYPEFQPFAALMAELKVAEKLHP